MDEIHQVLVKQMFDTLLSECNADTHIQYQREVLIMCCIGVEGFEPPRGGTKTRCLTAWLHPINFFNHPHAPLREFW